MRSYLVAISAQCTALLKRNLVITCWKSPVAKTNSPYYLLTNNSVKVSGFSLGPSDRKLLLLWCNPVQLPSCVISYEVKIAISSLLHLPYSSKVTTLAIFLLLELCYLFISNLPNWPNTNELTKALPCHCGKLSPGIKQ